MKQRLSGVPVCCGVDWITVSQRQGPEMDLLREKAFALAAVELSNGNYGRAWGFHGYEGFSVGGVFYGERYDGCLYQLTSAMAQAHWRGAYENCSSVTRIDLQVTVRTTEDPSRVIRRHIKEFQKKKRSMKKAPAVKWICDEGEAYTVYSGRPSSDRYLRIYDKGRESRQSSYQNCVRYEAVLRKKKAMAAASKLFRVSSPQSHIPLDVLAFVSERGGSVTSLANQFKRPASVDDLIYPVSPSNFESRSAWLRIQVGPTARLIQERIGTAGVLELLGLH